MTRKLLALAVVGAALMAVPASSVAWNSTVVPVNGTYAGKTYGQWSAAWWQWAIAQPAEHHPLSGAIDNNRTADPAANCAQGQAGPVWFLGGVVNNSSSVTRTCSVPARAALYFPIGNAECSNREAPPSFGATDADRIACARGLADGFKHSALEADLDGHPFAGLVNQRVASPPFDFTLPDCASANILGVGCPPRQGRAADNGYYLLLRPLSPGRHRLHFHAGSPGFTLDIIYCLRIK